MQIVVDVITSYNAFTQIKTSKSSTAPSQTVLFNSLRNFRPRHSQQKLINEEFAVAIFAHVCRFIVTDSFAKFKENLVIKEQQGAIFGQLLLVMSVLTTASYYLWEYFVARHLNTEFP